MMPRPAFFAVAMILLPLLGALAGRAAAPALARLNYLVKVAEHVAAAEAGRPLEPDDKYVAAYRTTGLPPASIYAQAREVRSRLQTGGLWLGLALGLIASFKMAALLRGGGRRAYDADPAHCLACGRCYLSCPVERERLELAAGERSP